MMKKLALIIVALFVFSMSCAYAAESPEVICENEVAVISIEESCNKCTKVSNVLIDGQLYMKVYKIYKHDGFTEHFVRYVDESGFVKKAFHWLVMANGKLVFPKGKPVRIITMTNS